MKAHIYALGWHRNNCLKVILNSVDLRANIAVMKILVKLLITQLLCYAYTRLFTRSLQKKTINETNGW